MISLHPVAFQDLHIIVIFIHQMTLQYNSTVINSYQQGPVCNHYLHKGADNKPHFANPAAVQRAAAVLGTTQEDISEIIFAPPVVNQFTMRMRRQSQSKTELTPSSSPDNTPERQAKATAVQYVEALEGFAMGLYQEAFAALVRFINR